MLSINSFSAGAASCSFTVLIKTDTKPIFLVFWARSSAKTRAIIVFLSPSKIEDMGGPTSLSVRGMAIARVPNLSSVSLRNSWFAFPVSIRIEKKVVFPRTSFFLTMVDLGNCNSPWPQTAHLTVYLVFSKITSTECNWRR